MRPFENIIFWFIAALFRSKKVISVSNFHIGFLERFEIRKVTLRQCACVHHVGEPRNPSGTTKYYELCVWRVSLATKNAVERALIVMLPMCNASHIRRRRSSVLVCVHKPTRHPRSFQWQIPFLDAILYGPSILIHVVCHFAATETGVPFI